MIGNIVYFTHTGIGLNNFMLVRESLPADYKYYFYFYGIYKFITEKKISFKNTEEKYSFIHNHWSSGYHHWLAEALVRIIKLKENINLENVNLIFPQDYPSFARESLRAFSFKKVIYLPKQTGFYIHKNNLIFEPTPPSGIYVRKELLQLRRELLNCVEKGEKLRHPFRKIYVTRRKAKVRKVENEAEVIEFLKKKDFEIIETEKMSFWEQVKLFAETKVFVSIHGAALTNMIFMEPKKGRVIEFYRKNNNKAHMNLCYENMAKSLGINHRYLFCDTGINLGSHIDKINLIVSLKELEKLIL